VLKAAQAELKAYPVPLRRSTLAMAVLDLARRLDAGPEDREVTAITRELRLVLGELRRLAALEVDEEVFDVGRAAMGD
jgi:hypothetical protein